MSHTTIIEPMTEVDLEEVLEIEQASFPRPWSARSFLSELALPYGCYVVARWPLQALSESGAAQVRPRFRWWLLVPGRPNRAEERGPVIGYAGLQIIFQEGHITTLAVHPAYRRQRIGEKLLLHLFGEARRRGVLRLTLEVRASNQAAQNLYLRYGFHVEGRRPHYYGDGEDALIMWTGQLDTAESQARLEELRRRVVAQTAAAEDSVVGGKP